MAYPRQSIRQRYLTLEEINSKDPILHTPQSSFNTAPASVNTPSLQSTSEGDPSMTCHSPEAILGSIRRLYRVSNFEKIPGRTVSSQSEDIQDLSQEVRHPNGRNDELCPDGSSRDSRSFGSVQHQKSCTPMVEVSTVGIQSTIPMIEPLVKLSDFQTTGCKTEGKEMALASPMTSETEELSKYQTGSQGHDQNFIAPKISFNESWDKTVEELYPRVRESSFVRTECTVSFSDSDLESLQSVSEPGSDSESWVNEPTIAELERKLQVKGEELKELSRRLEASPSKLPLRKSNERASKSGLYSMREVPCYCQGDHKSDDKKVPLPILKIQIRNLRQQLSEISEERKHYKETLEKLQSQFYSLIRRKSEIQPSQESKTISALRHEIATSDKVRGELCTSLNNLDAHCREEKNAHNSISASLIAKYDSLLKAHTHLRNEFESLLRVHTVGRSARLNQECLQQNIDNLKDLIEKMNDTQTARYNALETYVCSVCSRKMISPELETRTPTTAFETSELTQKLHSNSFPSLHLPSLPPSSSFSPPLPSFNTDTTSKTIAKLNHRLTFENARLTRAAKSDGTMRDYQTKKINQLTQRCAQAHTMNDELRGELATLKAAHQKLEKAHLNAQEAYKALERSTSRAVGPVSEGELISGAGGREPGDE